MSKMMTFKRTTILKNNVKLTCDLMFPIIGSEKDEVYDERMEQIIPILEMQYTGAVKRAVDAYEHSMLPTKFIEGQEIVVMPLPTHCGLHGAFNLVGDAIIVDADSICGLYGYLPSEFLFGHEMGHKIAKYRADNAIYKELASILGVSANDNYQLLNETYADECGNMVSNEICDHGILPQPLSTHKREGVKQLILKSIYR